MTSPALHTSPDPHGVSAEEASSYYYGLPSKSELLYRTGKKQWSAPEGHKELFPVYLERLGRKVSAIMKFTSSIVLIRFKTVEMTKSFKPARHLGWRHPDTTTPTAAHAAENVFVLFQDYQIIAVDVEFRHSVCW